LLAESVAAMKPLRRLLPAALALASLLAAGTADAGLEAKAEVLSTGTSASTIRFTFSGTFSDLAAPVNLREFVFIDFSGIAPLEAALPNTLNLTSFISNSVGTSAGGAVTTVELRNNEAGYYDRIGFVFDRAFAAGDSFAANSVLEISIPTSAAIATADFDNLDLYWGFPNWGSNSGRGTWAGKVVNPPSNPPAIQISRNAAGRLEIVFTGVLESSTDLFTPFAPVPDATSPYLVPEDAPATMFYRASD
jgi:hypothetical protein